MRIEQLERLIAKLNAPCRKTLDEAVQLCALRTNPTVEVEHWLQAMIGMPGTDLSRICTEYEIDLDRLLSQLTARLDRQKRSASDSPRISERLLELVGQAWLIASIDYQAHRITTGHLVSALFSEEAFRPLTELTDFARIPIDSMRASLANLTKGSFESDAEQAVAGTAQTGCSEGPAPPSDDSALTKFTIDLTEQARQGAIDPIVGRDAEIRQLIDILQRRRQNNPILTGEAGVGKTAVVEGFAQRIADGTVPDKLKNNRVLALDLGALQAGAGVRGEFERRLKGVIDEVKSSSTPIILFIDEAHTLVGAGGSAGQGDAANLLKPALARGELRTIAATTWAEYKKYFEDDAALSRRFQVVKVDEPDHATAVAMMRGLVPTLEKHHGVRIDPDAIEAAVELSSRYVAGRQLPDKAVSVIDTTCARVALGQTGVPPHVEDTRRRIETLTAHRNILKRALRIGKPVEEQLQQVERQWEELTGRCHELEQQWEQERELADRVRELTERLIDDHVASETGTPPDAEQGDGSGSGDGGTTATSQVAGDATPLTDQQRQDLLSEMLVAEKELLALQGEKPLVKPTVTSQAVAETIEGWTGIPLRKMVSDEIHTVLNLQQELEKSIVGQNQALEVIAERIITSRAEMRDPRTPIGVFLLAGTSGVGKTETAIALADLLYGGEQNMTVINMTEFKEEHKVSQLMGPPPGYKGYEAGGVLTEAVRRKPYSVVLLDEFEKAHEGVQEIFYQVFDKGSLRDGQGRDIDFKNTVIMMTTNAASDFIAALCDDPETTPDPDTFLRHVRPELLKAFKPAFLGRTTVVPYYPLRDDVLQRIVRLKLGKVEQRVRDRYQAECRFGEDVIRLVAERCTEADAGARNVDHIVNKNILPQMSAAFLKAVAAGRTIRSVEVAVAETGDFDYRIEADGPSETDACADPHGA